MYRDLSLICGSPPITRKQELIASAKWSQKVALFCGHNYSKINAVKQLLSSIQMLHVLCFRQCKGKVRLFLFVSFFFFFLVEIKKLMSVFVRKMKD